MKRIMVFASVFVVSLMAVAAHALPVAPLFATDGTGTLLSDNSAEIYYDMDLSGDVSRGDIFVGIVGINTIEAGGSSVTIGSTTAYNEITAIQAAKVASVTTAVPSQTNKTLTWYISLKSLAQLMLPQT